MLRLLSHPCVRARFCIADLCVQHYCVKYSVTVPWLSVLTSNTLGLSSTSPVRHIHQQHRQFAASVLHTPRRKPRQRADVIESTRNIPQTERNAENSKPDHAFGEYSPEYTNRTTFKKSSPQYMDLRYSEGEDEKLRPKFRSRTGQKNTPYWYFLQCKKLIKQDKLPEALDMFETEMLQGERLQPEEYNYTVLMGGCGRVGYIKKAFKLYQDMKKRGLEPTEATYTALFNACAESPWKQPALEQALKLEQELRRKNILLNAISHRALLKTMALTADLQSSLRVFRDMLESGHPITQETFHCLLMSCVKDKTAGFRLALQVWHQMLKLGIKPDTHNYNILLRATRDCGIGDIALASKLLLKKQNHSPLTLGVGKRDRKAKIKESSRPRPLDIDAFESQLFVDTRSQQTYTKSIESTEECRTGKMDLHTQEAQREHITRTTDSQGALQVYDSNIMSICSPGSSAFSPPNLLDPATVRSDDVSLGTVSSASDRLALIGSMEGFLGKMAEQGLQPTLKTLTLLADVVEPGDQAVQALLSVANENKIKLDVPFFNSLIRRAANTGDLKGAKAILEMMSNRRLFPDVQSFCNVALACNTKHEGLQLLSDMESCRIAPNAHVYSALIRQATRRLDYVYLKEILASMQEKQVAPNEVILRQLEFAAQYPPNYDKYKSKNTYLEKIDGFRGYYQVWLQIMPGQETPHPWAKFQAQKTATEEDTEK
ncbi:pentatricopeptide repeat-containing protein 1, mitochondrial [Alosa sapidissima]|uniref:pentatricopeptide repeat-containing protein 1, mitochondrial n=1 Tax=Alosa sapidissima TaxID=34773 RepID=UPI001C09103B|nr:pentatricopeptide repeat-containing protein 1, mitochondrial [Alosa sapidissima]